MIRSSASTSSPSSFFGTCSASWWTSPVKRISGPADTSSQSWTMRGRGARVGLSWGNETISATLSTFQLSPPMPPPNCVLMITPSMSETRGASLGRLRIARWVSPFSQLCPSLNVAGSDRSARKAQADRRVVAWIAAAAQVVAAGLDPDLHLGRASVGHYALLRDVERELVHVAGEADDRRTLTENPDGGIGVRRIRERPAVVVLVGAVALHVVSLPLDVLALALVAELVSTGDAPVPEQRGIGDDLHDFVRQVRGERAEVRRAPACGGHHRVVGHVETRSVVRDRVIAALAADVRPVRDHGPFGDLHVGAEDQVHLRRGVHPVDVTVCERAKGRRRDDSVVGIPDRRVDTTLRRDIAAEKLRRIDPVLLEAAEVARPGGRHQCLGVLGGHACGELLPVLRLLVCEQLRQVLVPRLLRRTRI